MCIFNKITGRYRGLCNTKIMNISSFCAIIMQKSTFEAFFCPSVTEKRYTIISCTQENFKSFWAV